VKNISNKEKNQIRLFYIAFLVILVVATTAPHIIHDDGIIGAKYAQSLVILFDLIIGYILFKVFSNKIKLINKQSRLYENRLSESYKYIGKAHGETEVLDIFFGYLKKFNKDSLNNKYIFNEILSFLIISVVKIDRGAIRFVNIISGRTVTEFFFSKDDKKLEVNLSNTKIIKGKIDAAGDYYVTIFSDFEFGDLKCVLIFPQSKNKPNIKLLKLLLNQIHSFFVSFKK